MEEGAASPKVSRKFPRVNLSLRADSRILVSDTNPEWFSPDIKNLGGGGLTFTFPAPIPVGTQLQMQLHHYKDNIDLIGTIVWTKKTRDRDGLRFTSEFTSGIEFTEISNDNLAGINRILNTYLNTSANQNI